MDPRIMNEFHANLLRLQAVNTAASSEGPIDSLDQPSTSTGRINTMLIAPNTSSQGSQLTVNPSQLQLQQTSSSSMVPQQLSRMPQSRPAYFISPRVAGSTGRLPPMEISKEAYYRLVGDRLHQEITQDWFPHVMSPAEVEQHRILTHRRINQLLELYKEQTRLLPLVDRKIEDKIYMARVDYQTRFSRTFRINDLPTEVLTNIFRYVCWSTPDPRSAIRARLYLTWTCHRWRTVAIADQTIWNAIWCSDYPEYVRSFIWFDRSGTAPIDLRINDTKSRPWTLAIAKHFIGRLFTKLSQIRVMVIVLQDWDPILYILHALRQVKEQNTPMVMERLELHRSGNMLIQLGQGFEPKFYNTPIPLFGGAYVPTLMHLVVSSVHLDWSQTVIKNMHALDMRRVVMERMPSIHDFRNMLKESPKIRKLVLDSAGPLWSTEVIDEPPVALDNLHSLALGSCSSAYAVYTLSQFTCVNLVDITLMNLIQDDFVEFYQMLTDRVPALRVMTIFGASMNLTPQSQIIFVKFLQSVPHLSFLRLNRASPIMLDMFLYDIESIQSTVGNTEAPRRPICPLINIIELHMQNVEHIARWITARRYMGIPVRKVYFNEEFLKAVPADERQKLELALVGTGVICPLYGVMRPSEELALLEEVI